MTFAWYGHLKEKGLPLWKAILISWGITFFEYCLMVPANRGVFCRPEWFSTEDHPGNHYPDCF
jgi:uncharacterized protein (DUF486 family)